MKTERVPHAWQNDSRCLYPTFKEWKRQRTCKIISNNRLVYILPLRNENENEENIKKCKKEVYILPLRNENPCTLNGDINLFFFVYILPLRNENKNDQEELIRVFKFISYL